MATKQKEQRRVTAWAVKSAREFHEMSRDELAVRLEEATGEPWDYAKVSNLENSRRIVDIELLRVLSEILELPLEWFVHGPAATLTRAGLNRRGAHLGP